MREVSLQEIPAKERSLVKSHTVRLMCIFDRWGELVFEATNFPANEAGFGWDGTFRGKSMNLEVFVWLPIVPFSDGTELAKAGDLTLIR